MKGCASAFFGGETLDGENGMSCYLGGVENRCYVQGMVRNAALKKIRGKCAGLHFSSLQYDKFFLCPPLKGNTAQFQKCISSLLSKKNQTR